MCLPTEADLGLEDRVRDWLEQSLSEFSDVDTNLETLQMKDAPFTYDWEAFAHDTLLKLHKLEEVSSMERLLGLWDSCQMVGEAK